jgi:hypothetical protein
MIMFYVCDTKWENSTRLYGVKDTDDGVVEYLTVEQIKSYVEKGNRVIGFANFGVFPITEKQTDTFDTFIKLLCKFNDDHNKDGKFRFKPETFSNYQGILNTGGFEYYSSGGLGGFSIEHVFQLMPDGNIVYYRKQYSSAVAAQVGDYYGAYSEHLVLYFEDKPNYRDKRYTYKYIKSIRTFYNQISG